MKMLHWATGSGLRPTYFSGLDAVSVVLVIFCWDIFIIRFDHADLRPLNYHLDVQRSNRFGCM